MARKATQLREKQIHVQEEESQGASLEIVPAERISRLGDLVEREIGLEIGPRDSGWSAEAIAEWESEMSQFFGGDKRGFVDRLD